MKTSNLFFLVTAFQLVFCLTSKAQTNTFPSTGNVGIGTSAPTRLLEVANQNNSHTLLGGLYVFGTAAGTPSDNNGISSGGYYTGSGVTATSTDFTMYQMVGGSHYFASAVGLTPGAAITLKYLVKIDGATGNMGIGTGGSIPAERLSVNGKIRAKEVKVEATGWPDYVFSENYKLPDLKSTAEFIRVNKHLPEIPSMKEVEDQGIELGKMNAALLKKIEELTLHLIKQEERLDEQSILIKSLLPGKKPKARTSKN